MFGPSQASPFQSVFVALVLLIVGFFLIALLKSPNRKYLISLFFSAFIVRTIFVYIVYYYLIGVGGDGFAFVDDRTYDAAGTRIAKALRAGKDGYELHSLEQNPGYFYLNGWLYSLLGTDTFSARVINAFLSSMTAILVFEIARILFGFQVAKTAGLLAAFMPSMVYWSVLQFKDTALVLVMVYTSYLLVTKKDRVININTVFAMLCALTCMWYLRKDYTLPYIGIVILWLILRYTGLERWFERLRKQGLSAFVGGFMLILGAGVIVGLTTTQVGQVFIKKYDKITSENVKFVEKASAAQIGFSRHLKINSVSDLFKLPFALSFTTILPLPAIGSLANADKAGLALYSMANLAFVLLLPFVVLGFMLTNGLGLANSILLRWFPLTVLTGVSIVFMGVLRYKEQLMPFFLIWAATALCQRNKYKATICIIYLIGFVCVIAAIVIASTSR